MYMAKTIVPVKLHQTLEVDIVDTTIGGMGIAQITPTYPLYLADAIPGERVLAEVIQVDKLSGYGRIIERVKISSQRIDAQRQYLIDAGTAPLVNFSYTAQLEWKRQKVQTLFEKANINVNVAETVGMAQPSYYRNKTIVPTKWQNQQLQTGFFKRGTHELVPMTDYFVNDRKIDEAIVIVRNVLENYQISAFDPDTQEGAIRYIMVRRGYYSHELMVVLVSNQAELVHEQQIIRDLQEQLPELKSLIFNYSPKKDYVLLSPHNRTLWGEAAIHDTLLGLDFIIGPNSFYQVNPIMTEKLYTLAAQKAQLKPTDIVIDAYSGIGTIGISVANKVKQVLGVEVVAGAVADAQLNVDTNHIDNAIFLLNDAPEQMALWQEQGIKPDVIFVDPPRRGLTKSLIDSVADMAPKRFVYISCNPVTLVRDTAEILTKGYHIEGDVQTVDQFPQTSHIETIVVFTRHHES